MSWSIANHFLLLDEKKRELIALDPFGEMNLSSGLGQKRFHFGDLVWIGMSPQGIKVVDRLENEIIILDYHLNTIRNITLNQRIFPENVAIDPWGRLFLYTRTYNCIYIFDNGEMYQTPFINLSKEFSPTFCMQKMEINQDGEIAILECNGSIHFFNRNGQIKISLTALLEDPTFLIPLRDDWFIFNQNGVGISIQTRDHVIIPVASLPIVDMVSLNRSIAVLSKDHILVLDVK